MKISFHKLSKNRALWIIVLAQLTANAAASVQSLEQRATFKAYQNGSIEISWDSPIGQFTYSDHCRVARVSSGFDLLSRRPPDLVEWPRPTGSSRAIGRRAAEVFCNARLKHPSVPGFGGTVKIGGITVRGTGRSDSAASRLVQRHLVDRVPIEVEIRIEESRHAGTLLRAAREYDLALQPPPEYLEHIRPLFDRASALNAEAIRLERRDKIQRSAKQAAAGFLILVTIVLLYRSRRLRMLLSKSRGRLRVFSKSFGSLFRNKTRPKRKIKNSSDVAQALIYWSDLKERGDITQEEFEERKKDLLKKS